MKRALLVGIDNYRNFNDLAGCISDVRALQPLLAKNEDDSPNFDCQIRTSNADGSERDGLVEDLNTLFSGGADVALFYFAGHGEGRGNDVVLVTTDGTRQTPGIPLSGVLAKVQESPVGEIIIILDCCFSG